MEINTQLEPTYILIELLGKLDTLNAQTAQVKILSQTETPCKHIIINCASLTYISSAGLRIFLLAKKRLEPLGCQIFLTNMRSEIKEIFDISGFTTLFNFTQDVETAIEKIEK